MKAVIFFSGLAGLLIFGPPVLRSRTHRHDISVIVHEVSHAQASWTDQSNCRFEAERSFSLSARGVDRLKVTAGSGSLDVVGVEGLAEVRAVGRACASEEDLLDDLLLTSDMNGATLAVEAHYPDTRSWRGGNRYARLDLRVEVPAGMAAEIQDGSGEMTLSNLGSLTVQDGSGELMIDQVRGDLVVEDGSGGLEIRGVSGSVIVRDGSGEIILEGVGSDVDIRDSSGEVEVNGVGGSLTVEDSSGELMVSDVTGSVHVLGDGSGEIVVNGVGGDFIVDRDGSGGIRFEAVAGTVDIPKKKRER